jgi:outer membrane receptor protein involved in Fe transport
MLCFRWDDIDNRLTDHPFDGKVDRSDDRRFQRGTVRTGLAWTPCTSLNLFGSWGQGFLPPATEQLVNNPVAVAGFNQGLTSALSNGGELGARGVLSHALGYEVTGFLLDTKGDFDRYRISEREGLTFYRNSGESQRYGAESRLTWKPLRLFEMDAAYTYSHFEYTAPDSIDGNSLPNSPEHQLVLDAEFTPIPDVTLAIDANMQSDWQLDTQNSAKVPGFALWGASLTWRWHAGSLKGEAMVAGRNLLGASYMAFTEPDPDGNSYQPGSTAEYFARIRLFR